MRGVSLIKWCKDILKLIFCLTFLVFGLIILKIISILDIFKDKKGK